MAPEHRHVARRLMRLQLCRCMQGSKVHDVLLLHGRRCRRGFLPHGLSSRLLGCYRPGEQSRHLDACITHLFGRDFGSLFWLGLGRTFAFVFIVATVPVTLGRGLDLYRIVARVG